MRIAHVNLASVAGTTDASVNQTSVSQSINQIFSYSAQAVFTGSPAGTVSLQASIDNTNFVDIGASDQVISDAGTIIWNVSGANYQYFRIVWVKSGGTGTVVFSCFQRGF